MPVPVRCTHQYAERPSLSALSGFFEQDSRLGEPSQVRADGLSGTRVFSADLWVKARLNGSETSAGRFVRGTDCVVVQA